MVGRSSPYSLYDQDLVTFEEGKVAYDHRDAAGFIRLNALRLRTLGQRRKKLKLVGWAKARTQTSLRSLRKLDCAAPCPPSSFRHDMRDEGSVNGGHGAQLMCPIQPVVRRP